MAVIVKDLGIASAYGYAKSKGYTGTEEEFAELMASYADVAQQAEAAAQDAEDAKDAAITAKTAAQTAQTAAESAQTAAAGSAQTASTKATESSNSAQTAAGSATAAGNSATAAAGSATTAQTAAQTATNKASEASSSASAASTAKTGAETARTGAQTAQAAAETAQENAEEAAASVSASAAQIDQNTADIGAIKNDLSEPIPPAKLKGAQNYGDLIAFQNAEIIESKYTWGVDGQKVKIANNNNYNYVVVNVKPNTVYRFPPVSWWAVTDADDIVVLGCGNNGTSTNNVDTTGYATASKLYVSIPKDAATVYVTDYSSGNTTFAWSLNGLVTSKNNNVFDIPDFKYITNKAWNMFFSGAWLRDAEYKRTSYGYSQFADHFSYRSTSTGYLNSRVELYDNNFDEIATHIVHMRYVTPNYRNLSALFIGDSTINNGGLTAKVLEAFSDNNVTCTLLGTTGSGDNKREGRSGWSAKDYCGKTTRGQDTAQNPFYNPTSEAFDFSYYMTNQGYSAPDFVFIQLGINDMFQVSFANFETGYDAFKTNMLTIVNSIHDYNANIKIVVNLITMPNGNISAFNTLYGCNYYNWERRYVDIKTNHNLIADLPSYVIFNPHNIILNPMTHISDDVHPTADGYAILGEFDADIMFAN